MPELTHVEVYREELERAAVGRRVEGVEVRDAGLLDGVGRGAFVDAVEGETIEASRRHGKHLFARLDSGPWLHFHFGMSGFLASWPEGGDESEYPKVVFRLDGRCLAFDCRRKLGAVGLVDDPDAFLEVEDIGPDALDDLDEDGFVEALEGRRGMFKNALMDQSLMAGIGNELSDELLFRLQLHPRTPASALEEEARREAHRTLRVIAEEGIAAGTELDELPEGWLLPRREEGADCPCCGTAIERVEVSGRGSYFCPSCQPEEVS